MLFNSFSFGFFFLIVTAVYFSIPARWQWLWLLIASCYFYMSLIPVYIIVLFFLIGVDYIAGRQIEKSSGKSRKKWLYISIFGNVGILFLFKYFNFFNDNIAALAQSLHWNYTLRSLQVALPIGLSFHVFQSLSYVIEVYRGNQKAEQHLGKYALYVMFFPQLVAGPIERPQNLLHQFKETHIFEYERVTSGLRLMLWGFFKKLVIADRLSIVVNHVYATPHEANGIVLVLATFAFAIQIFCDFSGYSDIARGSARVLGIKLMNNFSQPYSAQSIADFWRRWHISLSTWFKDYVYIPLGGSRVSVLKWCRNILVVFLLSGLWHGANWTYVMWGACHGLFIVGGRITEVWRTWFISKLKLKKFPVFLTASRVIITFCLVCFTWIFFRATNLSEAGVIISRLAIGWNQFFQWSFWWNSVFTERALGLQQSMLIVCVTSVVCMEIVHWIERRQTLTSFLKIRPVWQRWTVYYAVTAWILLFGYLGKGVFIYFQF